ncbi:MAG: hypothetical protein JST51_13730 [Armatimonadetes bacterium]|nr:hypothetical protein [Armatimonadota bacterium]
MRSLREPVKKVFLDTCVWLLLFDLGEVTNVNTERRETLVAHIYPLIQGGSLGLIFSSIISFEMPKNIDREQFAGHLRAFEDYGYATVLSGYIDPDSLSKFRESILKDMRDHSQHFESIKTIAVGDALVLFCGIRTHADEIWSYDPTMLKLSGRPCVRGMKICEPNFEMLQPPLQFG